MIQGRLEARESPGTLAHDAVDVPQLVEGPARVRMLDTGLPCECALGLNRLRKEWLRSGKLAAKKCDHASMEREVGGEAGHPIPIPHHGKCGEGPVEIRGRPVKLAGVVGGRNGAFASMSDTNRVTDLVVEPDTVVAQLQRPGILALLEQNAGQRDLPGCPRREGHIGSLTESPFQPCAALTNVSA